MDLLVPPRIAVPVGGTARLYWDSLVLVEDWTRYGFAVELDGQPAGADWGDRWEYVGAGPGLHQLEVTVRGPAGDVVAQECGTLEVFEPVPTGPGGVDVLVVGDSLTAAGLYVEELGLRLQAAGVLATFHGSFEFQGWRHEGRGGWNWIHASSSVYSPFVHRRQLNVRHYLDDVLLGVEPDLVLVFFGANDVAAIAGTNVEQTAQPTLAAARALLDAFAQELPGAALLAPTVLAPNANPEAFEANYGGARPREEYRAAQHAFARLCLETLPEAYAAHAVVDPVLGYPVLNAVHPNAAGYAEVAEHFAGVALRALSGP